MKHSFSLLLILCIGLVLPVNLWADVAKAELDTPWVSIGMPRILHLEVTVSEGADVKWPSSVQSNGISAVDFEDAKKKYLLEYGPDNDLSIDTIKNPGGQITLQQNLQIFAFDSAAMVIAPFRFVVNGDTISTQMLALKCEQPFESVVDDPQAFAGLKDIMDPEFVLWDYVWWVLYVLLAIAIAACCFFGYLFYQKHRPTAQAVIVKEKPLPAHVVALKALEELGEKKLWQTGQFKAFHTELTDILRRYIEDRYHAPAMESTTDEILEELLELTMTQKSSYNNLKEVLQMADLVKFAKYEPLADENQMVYMNARLFVEQTKESTVEEPGSSDSSEKSESTVNDDSNNNTTE